MRQFPYLYDLSHPEFKDRVKKENTWKSIGERFGVAADVMNKKWINLRDRYKKLKKEHDTKLRSGAAAVPPVSWRYYTIMESVLKEREPDTSPISNLGGEDREPSLTLLRQSIMQSQDEITASSSTDHDLTSDADGDVHLSQGVVVAVGSIATPHTSAERQKTQDTSDPAGTPRAYKKCKGSKRGKMEVTMGWLSSSPPTLQPCTSFRTRQGLQTGWTYFLVTWRHP